MPQCKDDPKRRFDRFSTEEEAILVATAINYFFPKVKATWGKIGEGSSYEFQIDFAIMHGTDNMDCPVMSPCKYAVAYNHCNGGRSILPLLAGQLKILAVAFYSGNWNIPANESTIVYHEALTPDQFMANINRSRP